MVVILPGQRFGLFLHLANYVVFVAANLAKVFAKLRETPHFRGVSATTPWG